MPPSVFFCGFAAEWSMQKASEGSNATNSTLAIEYQSLRQYQNCLTIDSPKLLFGQKRRHIKRKIGDAVHLFHIARMKHITVRCK